MLRARTSGQVGGAASGGVLRRRVGGAAFPAGMVERWTFDNTMDGYVGQIGGRVLTPVGTGIGTAAGVIGDAASLSGTGYLATPSTAALLPAVGVAYELWVRPATVSGGFAGLIGQDEVSIGGERGMIVYQNNSAVQVFLFNTVGGNANINVGGLLAATTWSHLVAVVHTGPVLRLYHNGVLVGTSGTLAGTITAPTVPLLVGARLSAGVISVPFTGRIDEPPIWQFGAAGDPGAAHWLARWNGGAGRRP